jgi:hypothetical protein
MRSGRFFASFSPYNTSSPFAVSTVECIASLSIAELPVQPAAENLIITIRKLPIIAAYITLSDESVDKNLADAIDNTLAASRAYDHQHAANFTRRRSHRSHTSSHKTPLPRATANRIIPT